MAIKPTDTVIWLDKVGYYEPALDWNGKWYNEYHYPKYWVNFVNYATKDIPGTYTMSPYKTRAELAELSWIFKENPKKKDIAIRKSLKSFNADWKRSKDGEYLKFKNQAQMTMFLLKWS